MFGLLLEFFSCCFTPTVLKKSRSSPRHQGTYIITFNPAARSCLPKPIVNLWRKLWLSLKFASHFIFWWPGQSSLTYSCVSVKWRAVNDEAVASLSRQISQKLSTRHALSTDFHGRRLVNMRFSSWERLISLFLLELFGFGVDFATNVHAQQHSGIYNFEF